MLSDKLKTEFEKKIVGRFEAKSKRTEHPANYILSLVSSGTCMQCRIENLSAMCQKYRIGPSQQMNKPANECRNVNMTD